MPHFQSWKSTPFPEFEVATLDFFHILVANFSSVWIGTNRTKKSKRSFFSKTFSFGLKRFTLFRPVGATSDQLSWRRQQLHQLPVQLKPVLHRNWAKDQFHFSPLPDFFFSLFLSFSLLLSFVLLHTLSHSLDLSHPFSSSLIFILSLPLSFRQSWLLFHSLSLYLSLSISFRLFVLSFFSKTSKMFFTCFLLHPFFLLFLVSSDWQLRILVALF